MMMRVLEAAGMPLLVDSARPCDEDNPHGYFEFGPVKRLAQDGSFLVEAQGRAVKVVAPLLRFLPEGHAYRVVFVERPLGEVLASQAAMLRRQGVAADPDAEAALARAFESSLASARRWLEHGEARSACFVSHREALEHPHATVRRVSAYLAEALAPGGHAIEGFAERVAEWRSGAGPCFDRMEDAIDPRLYRQRG